MQFCHSFKILWDGYMFHDSINLIYGSVCHLWLSELSTKEWKQKINKVFSHWQIPYLAINRSTGLVYCDIFIWNMEWLCSICHSQVFVIIYKACWQFLSWWDLMFYCQSDYLPTTGADKIVSLSLSAIYLLPSPLLPLLSPLLSSFSILSLYTILPSPLLPFLSPLLPFLLSSLLSLRSIYILSLSHSLSLYIYIFTRCWYAGKNNSLKLPFRAYVYIGSFSCEWGCWMGCHWSLGDRGNCEFFF